MLNRLHFFVERRVLPKVCVPLAGKDKYEDNNIYIDIRGKPNGKFEEEDFIPSYPGYNFYCEKNGWGMIPDQEAPGFAPNSVNYVLFRGASKIEVSNLVRTIPGNGYHGILEETGDKIVRNLGMSVITNPL